MTIKPTMITTLNIPAEFLLFMLLSPHPPKNKTLIKLISKPSSERYKEAKTKRLREILHGMSM
jgi:predicted phosphatase